MLLAVPHTLKGIPHPHTRSSLHVNTIRAERLTRRLMKKHRLGDWYFDWSRSKRSMGKCNFTRKLITLSSYIVALNDWATVKESVLHEIAHALAGPEVGHGPAWKAACEAIGARPEPQLDLSRVVMPEPRYVARCGCPDVLHERYRRSRGSPRCGECGEALELEPVDPEWRSA